MELLLRQEELLLRIHQYFAKKGQVIGDAQDCATFCASEAMELVDCFLRDKPYVRNHPDKHTSDESKGHEAAQVLMMLIITCDVAGIDLEDEFYKLMSSV
jgi:NTP pyrophosphatase (non-canonical NTP hydrolase)